MNYRSSLSVAFSFVCTVILVVRADCAEEPTHSHPDELLAAAEDMLVNSHVVVLGTFTTLSMPETKDIFSFRLVIQRFDVVEVYKGPNVEWIDVLVSSHALPFPGEHISVYEKNQRLNSRLTLLANQINELREAVRDMTPGTERKNHVDILRGFVEEERTINQQYPNLPRMLVTESPRVDHLDQVLPIRANVHYLVSLRAKSDGVFVFPEGRPHNYSPDTLAPHVAALRSVLDSAERMDRVYQGERIIGTVHQAR
ncbi:MAG: hypothetical protein OXU77_04840 [Gammaproteobacteria bacterium]|nr:hypothetical protein [Gammaproteobacteria bacterium]MDE0444172.1 hypothetical protein [Gammaproteobacteria bacterium]